MRSVDGDGVTRQRILDAAVLRFGTDGFTASVRSIAADAQVSAALVIHHFGSKDALRRECDERVLATIRHAKREAIDEAAAGHSLIARFAAADDYAPLLGYVL
ncbi:MAG: helix-turn-helix transcriptional regulator, partial [Sciscionella sp.]|nr:helix-turn-helix transcriptional regulator [Sciscionella sp.]